MTCSLLTRNGFFPNDLTTLWFYTTLFLLSSSLTFHFTSIKNRFQNSPYFLLSTLVKLHKQRISLLYDSCNQCRCLERILLDLLNRQHQHCLLKHPILYRGKGSGKYSSLSRIIVWIRSGRWYWPNRIIRSCSKVTIKRICTCRVHFSSKVENLHTSFQEW